MNQRGGGWFLVNLRYGFAASKFKVVKLLKLFFNKIVPLFYLLAYYLQDLVVSVKFLLSKLLLRIKNCQMPILSKRIPLARPRPWLDKNCNKVHLG